MSSNSLLLKLVIDGSNAGAIKALAGVSTEAAKTGGALGKLDQASGGLGDTSKALDNISGKLNQVRTAAMAIGAGMVGANGIGDLVRLADEYTAINSRLKLVAASSDEFARAQAGVLDIAQRNGRELGATATLYTRIASPLRDLGKSGTDALTITDAVAASLRIAGATAAESSSAQIQFAQALAAGTLQGEELNSVLESSPPLAKALATAMRVSVGDLKAMGAEGKLTGKIIAEALLSQADDLKTRAGQMESTIGESLTRVRNAFMTTFGGNTSAGAIQIAGGINAIANNMQTLLGVSALVGAGLAAVFGVRLLASIGAAVVAKTALIATERETAAMALATAQANVRAAQAEAARTLTTRGLAAAQAQLAIAERTATLAAGGAAVRAGGALLGLAGGPIGLITTALTLGVTAWQLWGNKSEAAAGQASKSLGELVKEMQDFGANASASDQAKKYEALAEAIQKVRQEESKLRDAARQRAMSDMNIATKAQVENAVDNDPQVAAKRAERLLAEKSLQDELTSINRSAANERQFIAKSLLDKQKAMNGELVIDEKKALATRLSDNLSAAQAVRTAWQNTLNEIKAKQAEAAAAPGKAADLAVGLKSRTDTVKMSGMSEQEKADFQAQQAMDAREGAVADQIRGRFELMKAYSQQLKGDFSAAKTAFDAAEKDLTRAFSQAEKSGDSGLMDEISAKLVDIEKQKGKVAEGEAKQLGEQAEAQRSKMNELEGAANTLKNTLGGMEVQVKIDSAMANLSTLEAKAQSVKAALAAAQASPGSGPQTLDLSSYGPGDPGIPGRAYGGPLPGFAPHDRADNVIYRGTPGEWVIQRQAVRYWGPDFIASINAMKLPKFAFGGQLGGSAINRLSMPSLSREVGRSMESKSNTPLVLDFGKLGTAETTAITDHDFQKQLTKIMNRLALQHGKR
ncbi:tape measure protein [Dechloromonas denitrificans]|uniref:tape measure protein n=1 Tax=Dechloromonas denitrificans TaxID=281362 RepID=UPI001CFB7BD0|nr:tape measure protein [Dechloromonas denitrificans]UCV08467.1 tape measure protein [Dechloromonas denitrificans]